MADHTAAKGGPPPGRRGSGSASGGARKRDCDEGSPRVAPSVDVTEAEVLDALRKASIRQLAKALDDGAFRGRTHGKTGFRCPRCHEWSARIISDWRWHCSQCPGSPYSEGTTVEGQGTRLGLRAAVAADYGASVRLVKMLRREG